MAVAKRKVIVFVVAAVLLLIILLGLIWTLVLFLSPKSDPLYVAHRGYSSKHLGNTEEAFVAAAERGFYGIETDVRQTSDGVFVCNHDETVKFADGSVLKVATSTYEELSEKYLFNSVNGEKVKICTFKRYLECCNYGGKVAFIELKERCDAATIERILQEVDEAYDRKKVAIIAFDLNNLLLVKKADPSLSVQYLSETKKDRNFDRCLKEGISIDVKDGVLDRALSEKFHQKGLLVNVWTVNTKTQLLFARNRKADLVTTDVFYEK